MRVLFLSVVCCLFIFLAAGCAASPVAVSSPEPITIAEDVPIWEFSDTVYGQLTKDTQLISYSNEFFQKPPYYTGSGTLKYTSVFIQIGGWSDMQEISDEFDNFTNLFVYEDSPFSKTGAQTYDLNGNLVAEIRLTFVKEGDTPHWEGKEYHYKDGTLIFTCTSEFDSIGEKTKEKDVQGKKIADYYFLLPLM